MQPSVIGKADSISTSARKPETEFEFQKILLAAPKGGSKTIGAIDARNAWFFDELRESGKLRTVIMSYDDVTRSSLVNHFGMKMCVEKGFVGRGGKVSREDIEREGLQWLIDNNVTVWEFAKRHLGEDGETVVYPGFDEQILETGTFIIGETARVAKQYFETQRPHLLIVDRCSSLHMGIGTAHALNLANKKPGDKLADHEWGFRTTAMNTLKGVFNSLPTHMVIYTGIPGEVKYRITVEGETVRKRYYDEPPWMKFWNVDCNVQVESTASEPVDDKGTPLREGPGTTFEMWVRTSQTSLVPKGLEVDITGSGISMIYEERKPKKKEN